MKRIFTLAIAIAVMLGTATMAQNNVGINTPSPDASAALDVTSTNQGVLVPRMNQSQRESISTPATGLLVWQTNGTAGFYFNSGTPEVPNWIQLGAKGDQGVQGQAGAQGIPGPPGVAGPSGQGVPTGGTTGQVLAKTSATDYNTQWTTPAAGSSGPILLVRAAANTAQNIGVSTNSTVPELATCFGSGSATTNVGNAFNPATTVFTAPSEGLYLVTIQAMSSTSNNAIYPYLDVNNDFTTANGNGPAIVSPDFLGISTFSTTFNTNATNRGQLTAQVYLTANQVFSIRFQNQSTTIAVPVRIDGATNFTIVKLL